MKSKLPVVTATLALTSPAAFAAVSDAEFQALKQQLATLTQRLAELEQANRQTQQAATQSQQAAQAASQQAAKAAEQVATVSAAAPKATWPDKLSWQGDFRLRYENIDQQNKDEDRNRDRIRARAGLVAKPQDGIEAGLGIATAQDGDPVSTNQTLGGGGSRKDIYLDLAYVNWTAAEGLNLVGGKFKNNVYRPGKHALLWDGDLNPEGAGINYVNGMFFANALGTWLESDSDSTEARGVGGQAGVNLAVADGLKLTAGAGYFSFNTAGKGAFYVVSGKSPKFFGNTVDASNRYVYDYDEIEGFAELAFSLLGRPASVFVDYVKNSDADEFDTGWAAGFQLGQAKARGTWDLSYAYQDLEKDAVFGLWTDSDFGGGGTDTTGHVLRGTYALTDRTGLALAYFLNEIGENAGNETDYDRLQLDLNFKY
jgi:hypothetical protein